MRAQREVQCGFLTYHPTMTGTTDIVRYKNQWTPEALITGGTNDKRFTDAELTAEMYRAAAWLGAIGRAHATGEGRNIVFDAAFTYGPITREEHEWVTMQRFLHHPAIAT